MNFRKQIGVRCRPGLILIALLFAPWLSRAGVDGKPVMSIDVQYVGLKTVSAQRILAQMSTKRGDSLSLYRLDEDVKALFASGEISNVRVISREAGGGVGLTVLVECRPLYGGVGFRGNTLFTEKRLARTLELDSKRAIDENSIRKARQEIRSLYSKRGYSEVEVDYRIGEPNSRGQARVLFEIDEGSQGFLREVRFQGNKALSAIQLKEAMQQKERGFQNIFKGRGRTDADLIAEDVQAIEALYRDNGYLDARVVNVSKAKVDARFNDLVFTIEEGEVYTISGFTINGVNALSTEKDIAPHLKSKAGEAFSWSDLQDDMRMIREQYGARGYIDAQVTPRLDIPGREAAAE